MEFVQIKIDGFLVVMGVRVTEPGVNRVATGGEFEFGDGLAKRAIRDAVLGAEFHQGAWLQHFDKGHGKGDVFGPAGFFVKANGETAEELPVERVEVGGHVSIVHEMQRWEFCGSRQIWTTPPLSGQALKVAAPSERRDEGLAT
jgi:hypothetical protein